MGSENYPKDPVDGVVKHGKLGLSCPDCGSKEFSVVDSRPGVFADQGTVTRRRVCKNCGNRVATYEVTVDSWKEAKRNMAKLIVDTAMGLMR